jgi:hypothetical protein
MGQDNITAGEVMGVLQGGVVEPGDFERALWQDATIRTVWRPTSLIAGNEERMRNEICPLLSSPVRSIQLQLPDIVEINWARIGQSWPS